MVNNIIKFIDILRSMNIKISIAETIESIKIIDIISIEDKNDFKQALCSILIKNYEDIEKFNKLFDIFFIYKEEENKIEYNEKDFENEFTQLQQQFDNNYDDIGQEKIINNFNDDFKENKINDNFQNKIDNAQIICAWTCTASSDQAPNNKQLYHQV